MPTCKNCGKEFPNKITEDGHTRRLSGRKFCPECSPPGNRNTRSYIVRLKEGEAFCTRCQIAKDRREFYCRKDGRPLSYCKKCQDTIKALKFEEKLETVVQNYGGACKDCGMSYPVPAYDFLLDGKVYPISRAQNLSLPRLLGELKDHIMLCKNCCAVRKWAGG